MAQTFHPYDPDQGLLLPPSLRDWLPEDHPAHFISDTVDELDRVALSGSVDTGDVSKSWGCWLPAVVAREPGSR